MLGFFGIFYSILFLGYAFVSFFIIFHLGRYSLTRASAVFSITLFSVVLVVLLFTNALLFFSLPFESLLSNFF